MDLDGEKKTKNEPVQWPDFHYICKYFKSSGLLTYRNDAEAVPGGRWAFTGRGRPTKAWIESTRLPISKPASSPSR